MIDTGTGGLEKKRTCGNHANNNIIKIGQNTEQSPGDLKRLAITQTSMKDHQLTLAGKTLKGAIMIIMMLLMMKILDQKLFKMIN